MGQKVILDEIGPWSEVKIQIIKRYAEAYSKILSKQPRLKFVYIDAFAGAGIHRKKKSKELVPGSPLNVIQIKPPFHYYYFIDKEQNKAELLKELLGNYSDVSIIHGDCNDILPHRIFPEVKWQDYKRALCFLDPYALHLNWETVKKAGEMKTIEVFINFPVLAMQRNVLRENISSVHKSQSERMDSFFGGVWWKDHAYKVELDLFGELFPHKQSIDILVNEYRTRLKSDAGFEFAPEPIAMRNRTGNILYYIFFATYNETGNKIVEYLFNKYKKTGKVNGD
jgi:three-Cys-motif partner protein